MKTPRFLTKCPSKGCDAYNEWTYDGEQVWDAKYQDLPSMKRRIDDGSYYQPARDADFSVGMYTCNKCESTHLDVKQGE